MFRIFAASAILALTVTAAQADDAMTASVTVDYGDLNLAHTSDVKILGDRLLTAAKSVCLSTGYAKDQLQDCMDSAITGAVSNIESNIESNLDENVHVELDTSERQAMATP